MNVALVGGGVMGEALLKGALAAGVIDRDAVAVAEVVAARRAELAERYAVRTTADAAEVLPGADVVLLAVKPQELKSVHGSLQPGALLISIMAGVTIATLQGAFGCERIVRVMPNTPAAIGAGISAWTATPAVDAAQRDLTRRLLGAVGPELELADEAKIDMATALSGSGPAYVFLFIEALVEGGVAVGLTRAQAEALATQTVLGSARYLQQAGRSAADLRAEVTSPAGTTAAALLELERHAFRAAIIDAVRAAHARAKELGQA